MIIGRSIQGIGGGGILTLGEILVTDLVPLSVRGGMYPLFIGNPSRLIFSSMVRVLGIDVGYRISHRTTYGRRFCSESNMEMDILD